jgi:hypothetical protein
LWADDERFSASRTTGIDVAVGCECERVRGGPQTSVRSTDIGER